MTSEAGASDVEVGSSNPLCRHGGLAFHKAYNVTKNLFSNPLKDYCFCKIPHLSSPAFADEYCDKKQKRGNAASKGIPRTAILRPFQRANARAHAIFTSPRDDQNDGVRQEHRINICQLRALRFDDTLNPSACDSYSNIQRLRHPPGSPAEELGRPTEEPAANDSNSPPHLPYWALPTSKVLTFMARAIGRWEIGVESLIFSPPQFPAHSPISPQQ